MRRLLVAVVAVVAIATAGCGESEPATAGVPATFFGIAPQDATSDADLARMAQGGVGSYHLLLSWARVEQEPGVYMWGSYDDLFGKLAVYGIEPVVYVFGTPAYLADRQSSPPTESKAALEGWDRFLGAAAARYGPDGSYWDLFDRTNPEVAPRPARVWEIWNEANGPTFWYPEPSPVEYARLFKRSERRIHRVDPTAQLMVAGMFATPASAEAINSFEFLKQMYAQPGMAEAVDLVATHPYGPEIKDVKRQIVTTRRVMNQSGDRGAGMWVTELGWGSDAKIRSTLTTTPQRQARLLGMAYELMIKKRSRWNLQGALWYTWRDPANPAGLCGWCASAGLVDNDLDPKPAWREYTKLTGGKP